MYGLGYGLSKMMEGATGGAVKGQLTNMILSDREKERAATKDYRERSLGHKEKELDLRTRESESKEDLAKTKLSMGVVKTALDLVKDAPFDMKEQIASDYVKKVYPKDMVAPTIKFRGSQLTFSFPATADREGAEITGDETILMPAVNAGYHRPDKLNEILLRMFDKSEKNPMGLGLAKVKILPKEKGKEYQPQLFTGPGDATKWVAPGQPVPEGYTQAGSDKGRSDFERAYQQYVLKPENAGKTRAEFRSSAWSKSDSRGELTDSAVLQNIREISDFDSFKTSMMWERYLVYQKEGFSKAEALNKVQQELSSKDDSKAETRTIKGKTYKKVGDGKWMRTQ